VYFTGGFNRWAHKRQLGPAAMRPPGINGRHWQVRALLLLLLLLPLLLLLLGA
jgi:hypothetical protein